MKKLFFILFLFSTSISFGQSTKAEVIDCGCKENSNDIYDENKIYSTAAVDIKPEILGWVKKEQFIKDNFRTPIVNGEKIYGKIYVTFVIEKDGTISNINILRDVGHGTGDEAKRILENMPKWNPAKIGEKIVRTLYAMPITIP